MATCGCLAGSAKDFYTWTSWTGPVPVRRPAQIGSSVLFPSACQSLGSPLRLPSPPSPSDSSPPPLRRPRSPHPAQRTPSPHRRCISDVSLRSRPSRGRGGLLDRPRRSHTLPAVQPRSPFCLCLTCSTPSCALAVIVSGDRGSKSPRLTLICGIPSLRADGSDYRGAPRPAATSRLSMFACIQLWRSSRAHHSYVRYVRLDIVLEHSCLWMPIR